MSFFDYLNRINFDCIEQYCDSQSADERLLIIASSRKLETKNNQVINHKFL